MSDPNLPPPPGEGQQPPGGTPPPPSTPPPGGAPTPAAPPPGQGGTPPPPGSPAPPGGYSAPPPGQPGGYAPPPAQGYQPGMGSGAAAGPAGTVLAEGWKRIIALLLDGILIGIVIGLPVALIVGGGTSGFGGTSFSARPLLAGLVSTIIYYLYYALMIGMTGQTLAGMLLKIKVIDINGGAVTQEAAFKREAWGLLSVIPCLGGLAQLVLVIWGLVNLFSDPLRQTPWDKFAETVVVDA